MAYGTAGDPFWNIHFRNWKYSFTELSPAIPQKPSLGSTTSTSPPAISRIVFDLIPWISSLLTAELARERKMVSISINLSPLDFLAASSGLNPSSRAPYLLLPLFWASSRRLINSILAGSSGSGTWIEWYTPERVRSEF